MTKWHDLADGMTKNWQPRDGWRSEPVAPPSWLEIDEDAFIDALEVLPPEQWIRRGAIESFILSEKWSAGSRGEVAWMFARRRGRFFVALAFEADYDAMRDQLAAMVLS